MEREEKCHAWQRLMQPPSNDVLIDLQTYENEIEGNHYEESFINVYEGDRHIFVSRELSDGGEPEYLILETDRKTRKRKIYPVKLREEREVSPEEIHMIELDKKAASGEIQ